MVPGSGLLMALEKNGQVASWERAWVRSRERMSVEARSGKGMSQDGRLPGPRGSLANT